MSAAPAAVAVPVAVHRRRPRIVLYVFLTVLALLWLLPVAWAFYIALRPVGDTLTNGYFSPPSSLTLQNFFDAWDQGSMGQSFINTAIITQTGGYDAVGNAYSAPNTPQEWQAQPGAH